MVMKIERVEVFGVAVPLVQVFSNAKGPKSRQQSVVVRVTATGGATGVGCVDPVPGSYTTETADGMFELLDRKLAPAVIGLDPSNVNELLFVLDRSAEHSDAQVAIEMACVDLSASVFGIPVHAYLGGAVTSQVEFNAWIGISAPEVAAAEALRWHRQGFQSAKVKVGVSIADDCARLTAIRAAVGPDMALRIDANESYDPDTSIKLARRLEACDIQLFEQPAPRKDLTGLARVRREGGIPVMADESVSDHASLLSVIRAEAADIVKLKLMKQGGFLRTARMLATAEAAGLRVVIGHGFGLSTSTTAEIMLAATSRAVMPGLECVGPLKMGGDVTTQRLDISSGRHQLPEGPGLGVALSPEKLKEYAYLSADHSGK